MPKRGYDLEKIHCLNCGELFQPTTIRNNKCSRICRVMWYKKIENERNERRAKKTRESWILHECLNCGEEFVGASTRVTCSSECSKIYVNSGKASKRHKDKFKINYVKKIPVIEEKEISSDVLEQDRDPMVTEAIKNFKNKGGKIKVLKPEPAQKTPSVDLEWQKGGWDWQALYGAGTYTGVNEYIYAEVQSANGEYNG